jgi:hypothetical protein
MKPLPLANETLFVRTDFSDATAWRNVCAEVQVLQPDVQEVLGIFATVNKALGQFLGMPGPSLHIVDDLDYRDATIEQLVDLCQNETGRIVMFVADRVTITQAKHPILVVDLFEKPGQTFRTLPTHVFEIDGNLSTANMDWKDFAGAVDEENIYRR